MIEQDASHPTGVVDHTPRGNSVAINARNRKARAALALRRDHHTWDEIAEELGYPTGRLAMVATERALVTELQTVEGHEFLRHMAADRYDKLMRSIWKKATNPEDPEHLQALDRARGLMRDHQELLGYAAPKQANTNPATERIEQWVAGVIKAAAPALEEAPIFEADVLSDTDQDD